MDKLSQQELERWAVMAWEIWNARNKYYFEHIQTHPKSILDGALGFLREYQRLIATQTSNWMCFDSAMLILNGMFLFCTTCCMATALYICIFTGFKPVLSSPWVWCYSRVLYCWLMYFSFINKISIFYFKKRKTIKRRAKNKIKNKKLKLRNVTTIFLQ